MKQMKVTFKWRQLYEAKLKDLHEAENKAIDRLKQLYKKEDARKQSRQIQICSKVPPSNKRGFWGNGPGCNFSNAKSNIMKKAKVDLLKSIVHAKTESFSGKNPPSTSKYSRPSERR